jgi:SAM-dependent methyltransferase
VIAALRRAAGRLRRALARATQPPPPDWMLRTEPVSRRFGLDRGTPIDRRYIEAFLREHAPLVRGRTLEVGERRYGPLVGGGRVTECLAIHAAPDPGSGLARGDLTDPATLPDGTIDCFICTQTFNFIYALEDAARGAHRVLRPGGVLLATVAGISQISRYDMERWGDFWRFTPASLERLLAGAFGAGVETRGYGNVLAATAFLQGLAVEDLPDPGRLDLHDPDYPVVVAAVARKAAG